MSPISRRSGVKPDGGLSDLTGHLDRSVDPFQVSPSPAGPQWLDDGFTTLIEERGRVRVIRVGEDGTIDEVVGGERVVTGASPSSDASVVAVAERLGTDRILTVDQRDFRVVRSARGKAFYLLPGDLRK